MSRVPGQGPDQPLGLQLRQGRRLRLLRRQRLGPRPHRLPAVPKGLLRRHAACRAAGVAGVAGVAGLPGLTLCGSPSRPRRATPARSGVSSVTKDCADDAESDGLLPAVVFAVRRHAGPAVRVGSIHGAVLSQLYGVGRTVRRLGARRPRSPRHRATRAAGRDYLIVGNLFQEEITDDGSRRSRRKTRGRSRPKARSPTSSAQHCTYSGEHSVDPNLSWYPLFGSIL